MIYRAVEDAMARIGQGRPFEAACMEAAFEADIASSLVLDEVQRRAGLPRDDDAEEILIGALLRFGSRASAVLALPVDAWYSHRHQLISARASQAIRSLGDRAGDEDAVLYAVDVRLTQMGESDLAGGQRYLLELADNVISCVGLEHYIASVREHWILRRFLVATQRAHGVVTPADLRAILPDLATDIAAISRDLEATCA